MQNDTQNIIGVDVGSGSVRAGVFNLRGELLAHATREITLFRSAGNKVEQSSREIWQAVCYCIKTAVASAGVSPSSIAGIGFDATCSLVVIGDNDAPLAVGPSDDADRNIIVWMDHRATGQAEKDQCHGPPGTAVRWRQNLAGDANAENFVAEGESPAHLSAGAPLLRPRRLPHLALNRR